MVRVTAHNGVSDQDLDGAFSRMIDIAARTANARTYLHYISIYMYVVYTSRDPIINTYLGLLHFQGIPRSRYMRSLESADSWKVQSVHINLCDRAQISSI